MSAAPCCEECDRTARVTDRRSIHDPDPSPFMLCDDCADAIAQEQAERRLEHG